MANRQTKIKDAHAKLLGLELNVSKKYRITEAQINLLNEIRDRETPRATTDKFATVEDAPSAWDSDNGRFFKIEEYCERYGLDFSNVAYYNLVAHISGHMVYNVRWKVNYTETEFNALDALKIALNDITPVNSPVIPDGSRQGVVHLADIHFGACVKAGKINPEYSPEIVCEMLNQAARETNALGFDVVHVHLLGDLIESFTGLMHLNQWKELDLYGVEAVKLFVETIKRHFLDLLPVIGKIKIVGGNHDRVSKDKKEDTEGGAAYLIAWGLELLGYDVEYSPNVLTHTVSNITYILNHGHHFLTKKMTTKEICWTYGVKGNFNFVCEGHLHSRIEKMTANRVNSSSLVQDDANDSRRMVFPSLFTGNNYSERGGWSTTPGFAITADNGKGKPIVYDIPL